MFDEQGNKDLLQIEVYPTKKSSASADQFSRRKRHKQQTRILLREDDDYDFVEDPCFLELRQEDRYLSEDSIWGEPTAVTAREESPPDDGLMEWGYRRTQME